jgi:hypothetical protein
MHLQKVFLSDELLKHLPSWWEDIDDDLKWQEYSFVVLSAAYGLLTLVALVQLVRIQRRVPEYGWTTQKVFHLLNAFVCLLRCVVFALRDKVGANLLSFFRLKWKLVPHISSWLFVGRRNKMHKIRDLTCSRRLMLN